MSGIPQEYELTSFQVPTFLYLLAIISAHSCGMSSWYSSPRPLM